jgi:hypothetical protein
MVHLALGELDLAQRSFRHAQACGAKGQPGLALLELSRGNVVAAAESIRTALAEPCEDELQRVLLLSGAVQISLVLGDDTETSRLVQQLEGIAGQFGTAGLLAASSRHRASLTASIAAD